MAAATPANADGVPDWLADLERESAQSGAPDAVAPAAPAVSPQEMPDWLRDLGLVEAAASAAPPPAETSQVSATLGPLLVSDTPAAAASDEQEIPDWLSRLVSVSSEEPVPAPAPPAGTGASPASAPAVVPPERPGEVPVLSRGDFAGPYTRETRSADWLPSAQDAPTTPAADEFEAISTADLAPEEVPDWLREIEMMQTAPTDAPPAFWEAPGATGETGTGEEGEAPAWMDDWRSLRSLATDAVGENAPLREHPEGAGWRRLRLQAKSM